MLRKIFMALLIAAASFNFSTTEAADTENYCCGNYYDNGCYNYYGNHQGDHHGDYDDHYYNGRGCRR